MDSQADSLDIPKLKRFALGLPVCLGGVVRRANNAN
jgi:hypothetical protein